MGFIIFRSPSTPEAEKNLRSAIEMLGKLDSYKLVILEEAPGYDLFFQGSVDNGILTGNLPEYNLEARYEEELFLRRSGAEEWKTAESMDLQGLAGFLLNPVEIFNIQSMDFTGAFTGNDITLGNQLYKTVYLELDPEKELITELFPDIHFHMIDMMKIGAALAEPHLEIKQLRIILEYSGEAGELERTYYLE